MNQVDADAMFDQLDGRGMIPDLIRQDQELLSIYLPILRADVTLFETYAWVEEKPFACPISVFGGREDSSVTREELAAWAMHSISPAEPKPMVGAATSLTP